MTLRLKLALTLILASIPLVFGIEYVRRAVVRKELAERLSNYVTYRFDDGDRLAWLEENLVWFSGPGWLRAPFPFERTRRTPIPLAGNELWTYDIGFVSDREDAPEFPEDLRKALLESRSSAIRWRAPSVPPRLSRDNRPRPRDRRRRASTRAESSTAQPRRRPTEEDASRPAVPLAEFAMFTSADDGPCAVILARAWMPVSESDKNWWWIAYGLTGMLVAVTLLAAGPMVRRIRLLTEDVREAADRSYESPVPVRSTDEIGRLASAFNQAGSKIREQIDRVAQRETALREFVANTTHDVMIPLTVLQGHLSQLKTKVSDANADAIPEVTAATDEAHYLGSILQNLSAVSKLEGSDYVIRADEVRLDTLVERVVQRHMTIARGREIEIDYAVPAEPTKTTGDMTLIEQAVSNVVHNAVRYNESGGHVAVLLDVNHADATFSLRVIDDGPGISDEDLARLPERRFRGEEARTRNPDGNGLGLHIARDVCEKHDFDFELRRSDYGGLEVEFRGKLAKSNA